MVEPSPSGLSPSPHPQGAAHQANAFTLHSTSSPQRALKQQQSGPEESKGIGDFLSELKMAREFAILGNYEEALRKYKATVQII